MLIIIFPNHPQIRLSEGFVNRPAEFKSDFKAEEPRKLPSKELLMNLQASFGEETLIEDVQIISDQKLFEQHQFKDVRRIGM